MWGRPPGRPRMLQGISGEEARRESLPRRIPHGALISATSFGLRRTSVGMPPPSEKDAPPNRGTIGAQRSDRLWLSAEQLHDHDNEPSWKAPAEKHGLSTAALIVSLAIVFLIMLRVTAVI